MKIIFSDFDGTLFFPDDPETFKNNLIAVEKWRHGGNKFALATGRSLASLQRAFPEFSDYFDYVLANNGASVFDSLSKKLFSEELASDLVDKIVEVVQKSYSTDETDARIVFFTDDEETSEKPNAATKIRVWLKNFEKAVLLGDDITAKFGDKAQSHPINYARGSSLDWIGREYIAFVDIVSVKAGKENAINFILGLEKADENSVFSIGDDVNDINMLEHHNGFAIKSSPEKVIAAARGRVVGNVSELIDEVIEL